MIHAYIGYRLTAVVQLNKANGCSHPKVVIELIILVGPL